MIPSQVFHTLTKDDVDRLWQSAMRVLKRHSPSPTPTEVADVSSPFVFVEVYSLLEEHQKNELRDAIDAFESGSSGGYMTALVNACVCELDARIDRMAEA